MTRYRKRNSIAESFISHRKSMRESFAWLALPDNARRVLDRLELEHMRHGGAENGRLVCTYSDFARAGIRRASVSLALRQCQALGFLECTRRGWCSASEFRTPSHYRLTYVYGRSADGGPTDEWTRIKSADDARAALARAALQAGSDDADDLPSPENIERRLASGPGPVDAPARLMRRALLTR